MVVFYYELFSEIWTQCMIDIATVNESASHKLYLVIVFTR